MSDPAPNLAPISPPLSIYVHIPWCVSKCPYCDFNSHQQKSFGAGFLVLQNRYIDAILDDLDAELPRLWGRNVHSVFVGGGTPSLLDPNTIDRLLSALRGRLRIKPDAEITLEANPDSVETGKFREFCASGINRLSIGIQSFDDSQLRALGRAHDRQAAWNALETAREVEFRTFNIDLMYGLPGQTPANALADINQALAFDPPHLSHYQLTLEPNTLFHRYPPRLPGDEVIDGIQQQCDQQLRDHGFEHYEVSAYMQPGHSGQHNLNYWQFGDYLGIGAGAHGKLSDPVRNRIERHLKHKNPKTYSEATEKAMSRFEVPKADLAFEFMLNALRLCNGFDRRLFSERTGLALTQIAEPLAIAKDRGLLAEHAQKICPTELGQRFLNDLIALFLPPG